LENALNNFRHEYQKELQIKQIRGTQFEVNGRVVRLELVDGSWLRGEGLLSSCAIGIGGWELVEG
jgi:hypothetical protein